MNKTLIILPGWEGTKESWEKFIDIAKLKINVKCLELPCFGKEPCPDNVWGIKEYAEFVRKNIKEIEGEVFLLGHSFGGQVAAYLCAKEKNIAKKLILSGPAIIRPRKIVKKIIFYPIAKIGNIFFKLPYIRKYENFFKKFLYKLADSPDYNNTNSRKRDIYKKITNENYFSNLNEIEIPTLIIWGKKDSYVPVRFAKLIKNKIPHSEIKIFNEGRHGLHIKMTNDFFDVTINFINK